MLLAAALPAHAQVQGAGATFPSKVYERWAHTYEKTSGVRIAYQPTGSGDGLKQISSRAVQFAGSDTPLPAQELARRKLVQVPTLVGGIVPVVHLPGIGDGQLQLTGELLADIMAGRVPSWSDARIAALNPSLKLPSLPIKRVVRADKSGTTEGFTRYLAGASPAFKAAVGAGQLPAWPGEVMRAEGNDGVVQALRKAQGAIAYVSYDRVERDRLAGVKLRNRAGNFVAASEQGFRAAILQSDLSRRGEDTASLMDLPGPVTWPITMTTFVLIDAEPADGDSAGPVMRYLYWCFMHGDDLTRGTGFAPLPVSLQSRLAARFASVKARSGGMIAYLSM
ncbi:MAG: phosphate ABC transporter substrate-binding protein PstS [Pseudomonadota bacterium]